jgi:hypothetical protein
MTPASTSPPASRRRYGPTVAAALALVVLVGCGVVGLASTHAAPGGRPHDVMTADASARPSAEAVHSGLRLSTTPTPARRVGHRLIDTGPSGSGLAALWRRRSVAVHAAPTGPSLRSSPSPTRAPPLTVL